MVGLVFLVIASQLAIVAIVSGVLKSIADTLPRAKALCLQFAIVAAIAWVAVLVFGEIRFESRLLPILAVGAVNAFGAYAQWQAMAFGTLSKTALLTPLGGILAAILAAIFLGEAKLYQNFWFLAGALFLFSSIFLFTKRKIEEKEDKKYNHRKWLFWISVMIGIVGVVVFAMKYFTAEIPRMNFLSYWYFGAFLGSVCILFIAGRKEKKLFQPMVWKVPIASILIFLSLLAQYWALQLAPLGVVVPIASFGGATLAVLVGLWIFKEKKNLTTREKAAFILGFLGLAMVIASQQWA